MQGVFDACARRSRSIAVPIVRVQLRLLNAQHLAARHVKPVDIAGVLFGIARQKQ